jgi:phosphotransferase system IIB component
LEEAILALVGGKENILTLSDCMTRLRITVKDAAELKALSGVMAW